MNSAFRQESFYRLIAGFTRGAIFSRCSPADPVKGHFVPLAAFRADAFDFLFVVIVNFIEIAIVIMLIGR